jgi:hypothetical protein
MKRKRFKSSPYTKAGKQYVLRMAMVMVGYIFAVLATRYFVNVNAPGKGTLVVMALIPTLPVVAMLAVIGMYLREEKNELKRGITVRSLLVAIAGTLAITSFVGFLRSYGVVLMLPPFAEFVVFWVTFGMMQGVQTARVL